MAQPSGELPEKHSAADNSKSNLFVKAGLIILIVLLSGLAVFVIGKTIDSSNKALHEANIVSDTTKEPATPEQVNIKEWGVTMTVKGVSKPQYFVRKDEFFDQHPNVEGISLTSKSEVKDPVCKERQQNDAPGFQYIYRIKAGTLDYTTLIDDDQEPPAIEQSAAARPDYFKKIGDYYFTYSHGNGNPCKPDYNYVDDYFAAFKTLTITQM